MLVSNLREWEHSSTLLVVRDLLQEDKPLYFVYNAAYAGTALVYQICIIVQLSIYHCSSVLSTSLKVTLVLTLAVTIGGS